jgi:hypothetical protein
VVVCFCVGIVLAGRPRLDLTADGVRMRGVGVWRRAARWDEIVPSRQAEHDSVTLQLNRPGRSVKLLLLPIRVHALFLSDAIQYYVEHPDHRAGIGTQVEYDHLIHALGVYASRP